MQKIGPLLSHFGLASFAKKMPNLIWHELKVEEEARRLFVNLLESSTVVHILSKFEMIKGTHLKGRRHVVEISILWCLHFIIM